MSSLLPPKFNLCYLSTYGGKYTTYLCFLYCSPLPKEAVNGILHCLVVLILCTFLRKFQYLIYPHLTCTGGDIHTTRVESVITNGSSIASYIDDVSWVVSKTASLHLMALQRKTNLLVQFESTGVPAPSL